MSMDILIRDGDGVRPAGALVLGRGLLLSQTAGGLPELSGTDDVVLQPSGGDDAAALDEALAAHRRVRLAAGTFRLGASVTVPRGRWLTGDGPGRTVLQATHAADVLTVSGGAAAPTTLEALTIMGVTPAAAGQTGIYVAAGGQGLIVRGLEVKGCREHGVHVVQAVGVLVSGLTVEGGDGVGLFLHSVEQAVCDAVRVTGDGSRGAYVRGGSGQRLSALRVEGRTRGIEIEAATGIVLDGADLRGNSQAVVLDFSRDVSLNACRAVNATEALVIFGGDNHVVTAFVSDRGSAAALAQAPHVWITDSGGQPAAGVTLIGFRKINPAGTAPTYEVDVSLAGSRVAFLQHNFDPERINSGGWFAAL